MSQETRVLQYLQEHKRITCLIAYRELGIAQLPARINHLRARGYDIDGPMVEVCNRWGQTVRVKEYRLRGAA